MNMMYYALSASNADTTYAAFSGEAWAEAGKVTLLGMVMVFAVLALLWGVLAVVKMFFVKGKSEEAPEKKAEPVSVKAAPEKKPAPAVAPSTGDNEALIAVITAAITAYRASEEGMDSAAASGFRVVSFKRAGRGRAWNSNK